MTELEFGRSTTPPVRKAGEFVLRKVPTFYPMFESHKLTRLPQMDSVVSQITLSSCLSLCGVVRITQIDRDFSSLA